jgi:hypothetical protein
MCAGRTAHWVLVSGQQRWYCVVLRTADCGLRPCSCTELLATTAGLGLLLSAVCCGAGNWGGGSAGINIYYYIAQGARAYGLSHRASSTPCSSAQRIARV